jgi:hypothetical protein
MWLKTIFMEPQGKKEKNISQFCFTAGTATAGPEVINKDEFHNNVKLPSTQATVPFDLTENWSNNKQGILGRCT